MTAPQANAVPLRRPYGVLGFGAVVCGGGAGAAVWLIVNNDRGLVINGVLRLSQTLATLFYGVLALTAALGFAVAVVMIARLSRMKVFEIAFGDDAVRFPPSGVTGSLEPILVPDADILSVSVSAGEGTRQGIAVATRTKTYTIPPGWFMSDTAGQEAVATLRKRC